MRGRSLIFHTSWKWNAQSKCSWGKFCKVLDAQRIYQPLTRSEDVKSLGNFVLLGYFKTFFRKSHWKFFVECSLSKMNQISQLLRLKLRQRLHGRMGKFFVRVHEIRSLRWSSRRIRERSWKRFWKAEEKIYRSRGRRFQLARSSVLSGWFRIEYQLWIAL